MNQLLAWCQSKPALASLAMTAAFGYFVWLLAARKSQKTRVRERPSSDELDTNKPAVPLSPATELMATSNPTRACPCGSGKGFADCHGKANEDGAPQQKPRPLRLDPANASTTDTSGGTSQRTYDWQTVNIFVSSTFNDMHAERDYLVKEVFPELRDWCEERKLRLVDIDLRWGVTESDAHNKNAVQVCLERIDEARPFFVCFLGQRYGWVPKDDEIASKTHNSFPGLGKAIERGASVTEMEVLHALLRDPFDQSAGLQLPAEHAFFYLRESGYLGQIPSDPAELKRTYSDEAEPDVEARTFLLNKQTALRKAVTEDTSRPARPYSGTWNRDARTPELALPLVCPSSDKSNRERWRSQWKDWAGVETTDEFVVAGDQSKALAYNDRLNAGRLESFRCYDRALGEAIIDDLKSAILARYPERQELPEQDELEQEIERHEDFIRTATDVFIERTGDFAELDTYATGDSRKLFALAAKGGLGKSTLLANWVARFRMREGQTAGATIHARFVGVGEQSSTVDALLRSILTELRRVGKLESETPDNANVLRSKFGELLGECANKGRIIVVIDALNQLQSGLADLDWLARTLPEDVKLVVSFKLDDEQGDALVAAMRSDERVIVSEVRAFTNLQHRRNLVAAYLRQYLKELDEQHLEALIQAEGAENPLFLKVVLTELRVFGAFGRLGEIIGNEFGTTPQSAFDAVLRRLENDPSYTAVPSQQAVSLLFGLLAHSRGGLPEDLLVPMFLNELGFGEDRGDDMRATIRLLLRQVRAFLARRDGKTDFFYEAFQVAARGRYTRKEPDLRKWHKRLALACERWATLDGAAKRYALGNLVYHEVEAGNGAAAAEVMTEFGYHYSRLEELGASDVESVTNDYAELVRANLPADSRERVETWQRFHRDIEHLLRRPGIHPEGELMQKAYAHGDTSPVTRSAEDHLGIHGSKYWWFRQLGRPGAGVQSACVRTLEGHMDQVMAAAVLPDGRRAVSASNDTTLKVWDLQTGRCLHTLMGHTQGVRAVVILPDGRCAVSASNDATIKVWDLENGCCTRTLRGHTGMVHSLALLSDGRHAVSGAGASMDWSVKDNSLKVWDLETGECLRTILFESGTKLNSVALSRDGRRVVSISDFSHALKVWDLETGECLRMLEGHEAGVDAVAVLPDNRRAVSTSENTCKVWDLETGECTLTLRFRHPNRAHVHAILPLADGHRVVLGSYCTLSVWDVETGVCLRDLRAHTDYVTNLAIFRDSRQILSASSDRTLGVWDLEVTESTDTAHGHTNQVFALEPLRDWGRIVSASQDTTLKVWDLEAGRCVQTLRGHTASVGAVAIMPNGYQVVSASSDNTLKLWDLKSGQCVRTFSGHSSWVHAVAALPGGRRALSGSQDTTLKVWDLDSGQCVLTLNGHTDGITTVVMLPDGRALSASHNILKVWDLEAGQCVRSLELRENGALRGVLVVLLDDHRVVSGIEETLKAWDLNTGQCVRTLDGHTSAITSVVVLPDGRCAVSASHDKTLKVWDLETGQCKRTLRGHIGAVRAVAVLPDGRRVVSAGWDTALKVWDVQTGDCLATWFGESPLLRVSIAPPNDTARLCLAAGCVSGAVQFFELTPPGRIATDRKAST